MPMTPTGTERIVLLVQRDEDCREMYAEFLRHSGFVVLAVGNGYEALPLVADADVVVTGILMTGVDGIELIRRIRHDYGRNTPIVVLTACAFLADRQRADAAGCDVFLPMPCSPDALLYEIRRLVALRARPKTVKATAGRRREVQTRRPM